MPIGMPSRFPKEPSVYILASNRDGVLYIGVTSNAWERVSEHKQGLIEGFTSKYEVHTLVYIEFFETMDEAIKREKGLKKWNRMWKINLIEKNNSDWRDLYDEKCG